jgi:acyl-CoA synthetase (AMP-forming)/AMP-acid ligase II
LDRPVTLARVLEVGLSTKPDEPALVSLERTWSWQELEDASNRLARQYLALGLTPGDRVASLLPNRGALLIHYVACFKAGLVATPLNYRYQAPEIDHALDVSGASILISHVERDDVIAASRQVSQLPLGRIAYGAPPDSDRRWEDLLAAEARCEPLPSPPPSMPAFIFFTSGSTGRPKGVTHTHDTFGWMLASSIAGYHLTPADTFLPATSASHIASSSFSLAGLAAGARVVVARTFDGDEVLPLLRDTRPTLLCMLPAPLFNLVRSGGVVREDFRSLRMCVSGGDKISAELEREFTALAGFAIEEQYGMTETGLSTMNLSIEQNRIGSMGQLMPGFEASIRDDDGRNVPTGASGRLWIRSPSNMIGYWNRPDVTAETIKDGWLDTGDLVSADREGYLWFCGRKKQIIIHDGSNICPQEVEESLLEHPAVASAGVVGVHDLVHGENVRAYVVFRSDVAPPSLDELIAFSRERVGYKAPDEIVVLIEMPTSAVGKVDRVALKQMADAAVNRHLA